METPEWMRMLEIEMVVELSNYIHPNTLEDRWAEFDCRLSTHLRRSCRDRLTNFHQPFTALKDEEVIKIGEYKVLRDMLNPIHVDMGDIIDKYTKRMQTEDGETNLDPVKNDLDAVEDWRDYGYYVDPSVEMKNLENELAITLNKHIHPRLALKWATFSCSLSEYLSDDCRAGLKNIYMVFDQLRNRDKIRLGYYKVLREMLSPIHDDMGNIIDEFTEKIRLQYEKEHSRDVNQ